MIVISNKTSAVSTIKPSIPVTCIPIYPKNSQSGNYLGSMRVILSGLGTTILSFWSRDNNEIAVNTESAKVGENDWLRRIYLTPAGSTYFIQQWKRLKTEKPNPELSYLNPFFMSLDDYGPIGSSSCSKLGVESVSFYPFSPERQAKSTMKGTLTVQTELFKITGIKFGISNDPDHSMYLMNPDIYNAAEKKSEKEFPLAYELKIFILRYMAGLLQNSVVETIEKSSVTDAKTDPADLMETDDNEDSIIDL